MTSPAAPVLLPTQGWVGIEVAFNAQDVSWVVRYHCCSSVLTLYTDTRHLQVETLSVGFESQVPCHGYAGTHERIDGIDHERPSRSQE